MRLAVLLLAVLGVPGAAWAQYKISEIVAKGGQVMTADQIRAEIVGTRVSGVSENGFQFELQLSRDGKLEGIVYTPRGPSGMVGTWMLNQRNQICTEFVFTASGNKGKRCNWYWKAGDEYYGTNSRTDDEAAEKFVDCLMSGGRDCDGGFTVARRTIKR
jgi:hypothetical protein